MSKYITRKHRIGGFTFIEIMLVIAMLGTISVALYNAFSNGLKIWERGYRSFAEEDVLLFFDKISSELRNTFYYSQLRLKGDAYNLAFSTIVRTRVDKHKSQGKIGMTNEIGKVEYRFDRLKNRLYRRQANYSQAINGSFSPESLLIDNLDSLKFSYYYQSDDAYVVDDSAHDVIPSIVKIEVKFQEGKNKRNIVKLIMIPMGS